MSSRNDRFECRWQASRGLLAAYLTAQLLAFSALLSLDVPAWGFALGGLLCLLHGVRVLPRAILLKGPWAFTGLRRNAEGWQLWSEQGGWQGVQLCRDSIALPGLVVVRFRLADKNRFGLRPVHGLCIPGDALAPDVHRRLRLRLKFSRRRWAAPE